MTRAPQTNDPLLSSAVTAPSAPATLPESLQTFIGHHQLIDSALQRLQHVFETLFQHPPAPEQACDGSEPLISALTDVREAAAEHFAHEEKLMEDIGFSQTDEHRQTHRFFLTLIQMEMDALLHGTTLRGDPLHQTLGSWLISHSRHQDAELALFLCRGGTDPLTTG